MAKFQPGQQVKIVLRGANVTDTYLSKWNGLVFTVHKDQTHAGARQTHLTGKRPDNSANPAFYWDNSDLVLVENSLLDDLRRIVKSLRSQGYDIDPVRITHPVKQEEF